MLSPLTENQKKVLYLKLNSEVNLMCGCILKSEILLF